MIILNLVSSGYLRTILAAWNRMTAVESQQLFTIANCLVISLIGQETSLLRCRKVINIKKYQSWLQVMTNQETTNFSTGYLYYISFYYDNMSVLDSEKY